MRSWKRNMKLIQFVKKRSREYVPRGAGKGLTMGTAGMEHVHGHGRPPPNSWGQIPAPCARGGERAAWNCPSAG